MRAFGAIQRAEIDLQVHDLDGNRVQDYWSRDIRGLAQIRPFGAPVGLIDERLGHADEAYPDAREVYGHFFKMLEVDENDRPLANPSGFGTRYAFCMYSARKGEFQDTWMSVDGHPWKFNLGRLPLRKVIPQPQAEGWTRGGC